MAASDREESELISKGPCDQCGSSDGNALYSDGHTYCFVCNTRTRGDGEVPQHSRGKAVSHEFLRGEFKALKARGLTEETCKKYGYHVAKDSRNEAVQVANYRRDGQIVFQKVRGKDKKFYAIGDGKESGLFGQHLYQAGRRLVITEGEIDAMSVAQALGLKWPVVSLPAGAKSAAKSVGRELEWVSKFDEVVLMFDMDEHGERAAQEVAAILPPGKARIAQLPMKDANEMLMAGEAEALVRSVWEAQTKRPDGILKFGELRERALEPPKVGAPWFDPRLTAITHGKRPGVYVIGAGTGVGKTDLCMEEVAHMLTATDEKIGLFFLEQMPEETAKRLAGKLANRRFHVPDDGWTQDELIETFNRVDESGRVFVYESFGSTEYDVVEGKMTHLAVSEGVTFFVVDNLTAFAAEAEDERKCLEETMAKLAKFAVRHRAVIVLVSHLSTPDGTPHEEGGRVMIRHLKGSRAIGFWATLIVGLERAQQDEDPILRNQTTLRVLKDRMTGQATGKTLTYSYDHSTGRLVPSDPYDGDGCPFPADDGKNDY